MDNASPSPEIENLPPADLADHVERLSESDAQNLLGKLPDATIAAVLAELVPKEGVQLLEHFPPERMGVVLDQLPANIAADIVAPLTEHRREQALAFLSRDKAEAISGLLQYAPDSAGGIMDTRFIAVRAEQTVEQCMARLRVSSTQRPADIAYVYVIGDAKRLVGVVALRDLVFAAGNRRVSEIMNPKVRFLRVTDDQEEIARQMHKLPFLGLPVVDPQDRLVGVVKLRDALRIAETEATEDMQLMVGLSGEERVWTPWRQAVAKRLPWLVVNLCTTLLAAAVVSSFEGTISRWTALVAFLPLISAIGGNAGIQGLTVVIRGMALGDVTAGDGLRALRKELAIGLVNGVALGLSVALLGWAWKQSLVLGVVAGAAMWLNQMVGALSGVAVPFGLRWFHVDPALASSILVTTLTDIAGFLVFLGLAAMAMRLFGVG